MAKPLRLNQLPTTSRPPAVASRLFGAIRERALRSWQGATVRGAAELRWHYYVKRGAPVVLVEVIGVVA